MTVVNGKAKTGYPLWTFIFMGLTLAATLSLVDWTESGVARPLWMFFLPMIFGVTGAVFAVRARSYIWGACSALLGIVALPILNVIITLLQGP